MRLSSARSEGTSTILLLHSYMNPSKFRLTHSQVFFFPPLEALVGFVVFCCGFVVFCFFFHFSFLACLFYGLMCPEVQTNWGLD